MKPIRSICSSCHKRKMVYELTASDSKKTKFLVCADCWSSNLGPCIKSGNIRRLHKWKSSVSKRLPKRITNAIATNPKHPKGAGVWFYCLKCDWYLV